MFVDGGESKKYDVDISKIYDFHFHFQQMFTNTVYQISPIFFYQCREPSPVSCLPSLVSCLPSLVSCLLSPVFCLPSSVSRLLSHVPMSPVSRLPCCTVSAADLIYNDKADLAILWSKFVDLGNLAS